MADTTWQHELLRHLHNVFHVSLSLKPVPADFNLTTEYLQSLMMVVAGGLALGFSVLVVLALFLCLVISYAAPAFWPSWPYRLLVVATAVALIATSSESLNGSHQVQEGLDVLDGAISGLQVLLVDVASTQPNLTVAASTYNATISAAAVCLGCMEAGSHSGWSNATRLLCGHAGDDTPPLGAPSRAPALPPGGLLSAGERATNAAADFGALAPRGDRQAQHVRHMIYASTGWHLWASYTQLYALTCTAAAVVGGAIAGRRNVLLLAQFIGVLVWWLMCAAVSVEFAIAVGFADACGSPMGTLSRVLRGLEAHGAERPPTPRELWLTNLTEHYLRDCTVPDPAFDVLDVAVGEAKQVYAALTSLRKPPTLCVDAPAIEAAVRALQGARDLARIPVGGSAACGGAGPIYTLYRQAAVSALCDDVADGFVSLFASQLSAGLLLLALSALLPRLWHSHHLPPFSPREVRRAAIGLLRPATWRGLLGAAMSAPAAALSRLGAAARVARQWVGRRWSRRSPLRAHASSPSPAHVPCAGAVATEDSCAGADLRTPMLAPAAEQPVQEPALGASVSARAASEDGGEVPDEPTPTDPLAAPQGRLSNEASMSVEPLVAAPRGVQRQDSLYEAL